MSDYYPAGVTPSDFDDHKIREHKYTLTIDDVLRGGYASVRGMDFDTHATVSFERFGQDGVSEITSVEIRRLFIVVHGDNGAVESFLLDEQGFKASWMKELIKEIESMALRQANDAKETDWELYEL